MLELPVSEALVVSEQRGLGNAEQNLEGVVTSSDVGGLILPG